MVAFAIMIVLFWALMEKNICVCICWPPGQLDGVKFEMTHSFRAGTMLFEYLMADDMTQVNGMVFLQDFTGVGPKLLSKFMNKELQEFQKAWVVGLLHD